MVELIIWLVSVLVAIGAAIIVVQLIAKPMRALLGSNSYMACAERFYIRAFALAVYLSTLASVVGRSLPSPEEPQKSMSTMEYVWWVIDGLESAFWSISLFLLGFVVLLTIVLAVLGRYREQ